MKSKEGGLGAPVRFPLKWEEADFTDRKEIDVELRRVFDICHGCRRCFNLCESFPKLFDLIDESKSGELDTVKSEDFKPVVDACTLCDMCFMTKCPYVPPHEFNLDFPHLMLRYRAMERKEKLNSIIDDELTKTDRNGKVFSKFSKFINWSTTNKNKLTRPVMEKLLQINKEAELPKYYKKTFVQTANEKGNDNSRLNTINKVAIFPTCFVNYNNPQLGTIAQEVLKKLNVESKVFYEGCCGMPQLEGGDLKAVAEKAKNISKLVKPLIEEGYKIISLVPSCSLMLKFEWPLILPNNDDVKNLSKATFDICEYIVELKKKNDNLSKIFNWKNSDGVTVHISCHSRAQNIGNKAVEMLRIIPDLKIDVIERCSGHGGSWGVKKKNFNMALKVGKPVARKTLQIKNRYLVSECPLAGVHVRQGLEKLENHDFKPIIISHPIEFLALASNIQITNNNK